MLLRALLRVAEVPYAMVVTARNARYDRGAAAVHRSCVPVVSVGNLTLGGTGKTPMVEHLARWYRDRGVRVGLVSRGYGARGAEANDEALELAEKLPGVPHVQNPDRVAAARTSIDEHGSQVIVLDDGFQHRRLARDLDIVLIDSLEPFGFGHVFPRGTLREPLCGLARADVVALSRADMLAPDERERLRDEVRRYAPEAVWCELAHVPRGLLNADGEEEPLDALADQPLAAFCGIGNPAGFEHTLATCGYNVAAWREFPDHHAFDTHDVDSLEQWATEAGAAAIVCTHKDLVKIGRTRLGELPLWAVTVALEITAGQAELEARLEKFLPAT